MKSLISTCSIGAVALGMLFVFAGCQSARYISKTADSGVVAIPKNTNNRFPNYREQASKLMLEHFPDGFVIEHEEEIQIGETTRYSEGDQGRVVQASDNVIVESGSRNGSATTVPKTEYRIHYRRQKMV